MFKKIILFLLACGFSICMSGCALIPIALSAAASYGIYQATRK